MFRKLLYKTFAAIAKSTVADLERDSQNVRVSQEFKLLQLIRSNEDTAYGKIHSFSTIRSIEDYQKAVPINDYDTLKPYILKSAAGDRQVLTREDPLMFATTSGTTGARKLIPVTHSYMREFRRASTVSGYNLLQHFPTVARGVTLSIFSKAEEGRTEAGIPYGAISGRLYQEEPKLIKKFVAPIPYEVFLIEDYESRYYTILRLALTMPVSSIYTLNPSTIMILAKRLAYYGPQLVADIRDGQLRPPTAIPNAIAQTLTGLLTARPTLAKRLAGLLDANLFVPDRIWPGLSLIACWTKASAAFYLQDFPEFFGSTAVCDITYGASEGRGTVFLSPREQMLAIGCHFFEFIQEDDIDSAHPQTLTAEQLEIGKNYYILFTTAAGLYRYHINDIVKVVGWHNTTPLLEFLHKGGNISSFTGEKLTESQVTDAVSQCLKELAIGCAFFTVIPQFRPQPHYELWFEPRSDQFERIFSPDGQARLQQAFDRQLCLANIEYETKRASGRLASPTLKIIPVGSYENLRKTLGSSGPDAQIKISHLNPKQDIIRLIESMTPYMV